MRVVIIKVCQVEIDTTDPAYDLHTKAGIRRFGSHCTVNTDIIGIYPIDQSKDTYGKQPNG